ncbi:hypothetical protein NOCA2480079 [metagenome]|uniref:Uncharacterized protein n=1 Tax=metagenome TaxID=256318 RepID=A0A2P2C7T1_9ZZZZ
MRRLVAVHTYLRRQEDTRSVGVSEALPQDALHAVVQLGVRGWDDAGRVMPPRVELNGRSRSDRLDVDEPKCLFDGNGEETEILLARLAAISSLLGGLGRLRMESGEPLDHRLEQCLNLVTLQLLDPALHLPNDLLIVLSADMERLHLYLNAVERRCHLIERLGPRGFSRRRCAFAIGPDVCRFA